MARVAYILLYVAMAVAAVFPLWTPLQELVPESLRPQISRNNEASVFVLLLAVFLDFGPRSARRAILYRTAWGALVFTALVITEFFGPRLDLPQAIITLREPFLALVLLGSYFLWSRHVDGSLIPRRRWPMYVSALAVLLLGEVPLPGFTGPQTWIMDHAEVWGFMILIGVLFDYICPWEFGRRAPAPIGFRIGWYLGLIAIPFVVDALNPFGVDAGAATGPGASALVWLQRIAEAFIAGFVLTALYDLKAAREGQTQKGHLEREPAPI